MNLVLIARKANLLNEIADEIKSKYGVEVDVIIADFGKGNDIYKNIEESLVGKRFFVRGHSTTKYVDKILPNLDPTPRPPSLEWKVMDILNTIYPLSHDPCGLFTDPHPLVHVVIACPLIKGGSSHHMFF